MLTRWYSGLPYVKPVFNEFIITVKTDNAGVSASNEILLPIQGTNMVIDWGDGNTSVHTQTLQPTNTIGGANVTHTYSSAGVYQIKISSSITRIFFNNGGDRLKLLEINNWGKAIWTSMRQAFWGCPNLNCFNINDIPNLSNVQEFNGMFRAIRNLNFIKNIENWVFSSNPLYNIDITLMFHQSNFNQDISGWNTERFRFISNAFNQTHIFNQNLNSWDTSNMIDMAASFSQSQFNGEVSNWDVSNVTNMNLLFRISGFNQEVNNWDIRKVTNLGACFASTPFNKSLSNWDTENVTNMSQMFFSTPFNQPINHFKMGKVTNTFMMFANNNNFNQPLDSWDVSKVTTTEEMFYRATLFNQDIGMWELNPNVNMNRMLETISVSQGMNAENYSRTLIGWANNIFARGGVVTGRSLGAHSRRYNNINYVSGQQFNNAVDARNYLVNTLGWTITGDAQV